MRVQNIELVVFGKLDNPITSRKIKPRSHPYGLYRETPTPSLCFKWLFRYSRITNTQDKGLEAEPKLLLHKTEKHGFCPVEATTIDYV